jgi:hypothetical protein
VKPARRSMEKETLIRQKLGTLNLKLETKKMSSQYISN